MRKRIHVCFLVFTMSIFYLLSSNVVFGQSPAEQVIRNYGSTLGSEEVQSSLPGFLNAFKVAKFQEEMFPHHIGVLLGKPIFLRTLVPGTDDQFMALLYLNNDFRTLFGDEQFYNVLKDSNEIDKLLKWFEELPPLPGEARICEMRPPEPPKPTTLSIVLGNSQSGEIGKTLEPFVVEVLDQNGKPLEETAVTFKVTDGDGGLLTPTDGGQSSTSTTKKTNDEGQAEVKFTLGRNPGIYQIEARVAAMDSLNLTPLTQIFTATAEGVALPEPTTLNKISGDSQTGETGKSLAQPFVVGVKDNANRSLPGIGVRFSVLTGGGSLDETTFTDAKGEAKATLTLGALPGENRVKVQVASFPSATRYFTATATARSIAQLPLLYWIEPDGLHRLSSSGREWKKDLVPGAENAVSFTVDMEDSKLYWATNNGEIYRANLDGTDDELLLTVHSVPRNIAINPLNDELYWTNESGRILRAIPMTTGKMKYSIQVIHKNLVSPQYIALDVSLESPDRIYWTEVDEKRWNIQVANLPVGDGKNGNNMPALFKKDLGPLKGIAVVGDKVYWTDEIDGGSTRVSCANVNGSGETTVKILESIPLGLAFNGSNLYWTTPHGGIQSVDLIALGNAPAVPSGPAAPSLGPVASVENTLLANYPNPFNPETWIPYQLSEPADVSVSIYSVNGHLVRRLDLGHQSAGVYQSRSRAAYWDGRNAFGERVASGLYFYTLTAGDFTATRKMLIRK